MNMNGHIYSLFNQHPSQLLTNICPLIIQKEKAYHSLHSNFVYLFKVHQTPKSYKAFPSNKLISLIKIFEWIYINQNHYHPFSNCLYFNLTNKRLCLILQIHFVYEYLFLSLLPSRTHKKNNKRNKQTKSQTNCTFDKCQSYNINSSNNYNQISSLEIANQSAPQALALEINITQEEQPKSLDNFSITIDNFDNKEENKSEEVEFNLEIRVTPVEYVESENNSYKGDYFLTSSKYHVEQVAPVKQKSKSYDRMRKEIKEYDEKKSQSTSDNDNEDSIKDKNIDEIYETMLKKKNMKRKEKYIKHSDMNLLRNILQKEGKVRKNKSFIESYLNNLK